VSKDVEEFAAQYMRRFAEHLSFVGCFAFEFFHMGDEEIVVNEIAPRVHNSAHYTLDANIVDQFANHIRAITGAPFDTTNRAAFFAMRNLLGPQDLLAPIARPALSPDEPIALHWYRKCETRAFRKLGHLNCCASTRSALDELRARMVGYDNAWQSNLIRGAS
jgi:5-(carboxyamino)imidazole ribonucleotide synthase